MIKHVRLSVLLLVIATAVLAVPYPSEVAPPWKIQAVDKTGSPVAGCTVTETWGWTPLDRISFTEQTRTDAGGWASLPRQVRWLNLARRIQAFVEAQLSFHGNAYGPVYWIMAVRMQQDAAHPALVSDMFDRRARGVSINGGVWTYRVAMRTVDEARTFDGQ